MRIRVPFLPLLVLSAVGAVPSISIAAPASETLTPETEVPALVKRDMVEARRFLLGHALVPDVRFTLDPGATPWSVIRQDPSPRTVVSAGTRVMVEVAIPEESPEEVRLPGVYGLEEAEAVALLRSIGLEVAVDHVPSRFPLGRAFAASSEAGARLRRGERVAIRVASLTPPGWEYEPIRVPDYRREKAYEAIGRLISLGLAPQWRWRDAPDAPTGSVLEQDPAPGTLLPPGAPVTLVEPRLSRVPDVVGRPLRDARDDLAAAHLTAALFGPAPEDAVVRETVPPAGRWASYGGRIRVRAEAVAASPTMPAPSATPDATVVPDLGGRSRWDAELLLTGAGLFADVEGDSVDDAARVDRQHPESGARAIRGDHVRVHLLAPDSPPPPSGASGGVGDEAPLPPVPLPPPPEPAASASGPLPAEAGAGDPAATSRVPDVVGMPRIAAQLLLVGAGFWPRTDGSGRPSSRVTMQDPVGGTSAPRGSGVWLTVGDGGGGGSGPAPTLPAPLDPGSVSPPSGGPLPSPIDPAGWVVPSILGLPRVEAVARVAAAGLTAEFSIVAGPGPYVVGSQDPAPFARVPEGTVIRATLSSARPGVRGGGASPALPVPAIPLGPGTAGAGSSLLLTRVPDLRGRTPDAARVALSAAGLEAEVVDAVALFGARAGVVASQAPTAGTAVRRGTRVRMYVPSLRGFLPPGGGGGAPGGGGGSADSSIAVPDVHGLANDEAERRLVVLGLRVSFHGPMRRMGSPTRVTAQDPVAGTRVRAGSTVRLTFIVPSAPLPGAVER